MKSTLVIPLLLLGAVVLGARLVFGDNDTVTGLALMAAGVFGLMSFMATPFVHQRPGERETVIEERHYIGPEDDHRRYHH
ncbi:hypothetical protein [Streptomyces sp. GC420]|uniref:hypothetical protein n=1 Tax=Streptomyces sp. GC420 TaxID=2697568 RepID=UPI0014152E4C|nr:hypothetical protein [Streptomyces sp. GC420]NBM20279.1 hypothetical protein [Streptomyces sp. GC420]